MDDTGKIGLDFFPKRDELFLKIIQFIKSKPERVYLVGGYLRDRILEREGGDIDLAVAGDVGKYGRELADTLGGSFFLLGGKQQVARIVVKDGGQRKIDICALRGGIEDDLRLRDFTINALAVDAENLAEGLTPVQIIDVTGGLRDLKNRKISVVSSEALKDDPLRVLRAVRLSIELDFDIEPKTFSLLKGFANLIKNISSERVQQELYLTFSLSGSCEAIKSLDELNVIELIIPEFKEMKGVAQNDYHHLDVWNHTLLALKNLDEILTNLKKIFPDERGKILHHLNQPFQGGFNRVVPLKFATLLHDIGKPRTKSIDSSGIIHFYNHSEVGAGLAKNICKRLKISKEGVMIVGKLVAEHMRIGYLSKEENLTDRAMRRFLRDCGKETVEVLLLSLADRRATLGPLSPPESLNRHESFIKKVMKAHLSAVEKPKPHLVTGYDLMKELNLKPGKFIGRLLEEIEEVQAEGKISTKKEALSFAKNYFEDYIKDKK